MPEAENHALPGATNDTWRTWLMTGAHRAPVDRRRVRGAHRGLKKMLLEGMANGDERPHAWKDFSGAMIRHAVDEAMRSLPAVDKQVVQLAYFGGYSNRAIAAQTGLTDATVQRRLRRALTTISEHIQRGRNLSRRAMFGLAVWLSGRWLTESAHHVVAAAAVAGVTAIIVAQPAAPDSSASSAAPASPAAHAMSPSSPHPVVPPVPSPTVPAMPAPAVPAVKLPVAVPSLPPLPVKVSPPPVHVPLRP